MISGTVWEHTSRGVRPSVGANVSAWVEQGHSGYSYMFANGALLTDAGGNFQLRTLPAGSAVTPQVWKDGFVQQCAFGTVPARDGVTVDLHLVARDILSAAPASLPPSAPGTRFVSGVIYRKGPSGRQPASGAFVAYEPVMDFPAAITYSDAEGRYTLCGLPSAADVHIGAAAVYARAAYITVPPGQTTGADIVVP